MNALREWNRLKAARRKHPDQVSAEEVSAARRRYQELVKPNRGKPKTPAGPATAAEDEQGPDLPPLRHGTTFYTDPNDAERAGRIEILLLVKYGLPRGEDLEFDEEAERGWLDERPAIRARVMSWLARRALADVLRLPPAPAEEDPAAN